MSNLPGNQDGVRQGGGAGVRVGHGEGGSEEDRV